MESKETSICPQCVETMARAEKCIREHPKEAALACLGAGFILAQLPLRLLLGAIARLAVLALKPAVLFYAMYRMAEDIQARRHLEV